MRDFALLRPTAVTEAVGAWRDGDRFIAGGTDLLQLMKSGAEEPPRLIDLTRLDLRQIAATKTRLELGALCTMAETAAHPTIRSEFPMISQALLLAASPQVRNMGTVGGNLLQRTRCGYFRDPAFPCNKREPGSGCPAIHGENRELAIFGVSDQCIANHPSDFPVALMALDAELDLIAPKGETRRVKLAEFYRPPGDTPNMENVLRPGEMIARVHVMGGPVARNSCYVKVRDRASFSFALVSAAAGLDIVKGEIRDARVALGGAGSMPWRLPRVEDALRGQRPDSATLHAAAALASDGAVGSGQNDYKIELTRRVVARALRTVAGQESL
jgi:xanthine dehydrogenase YagS FAD-binding subunit